MCAHVASFPVFETQLRERQRGGEERQRGRLVPDTETQKGRARGGRKRTEELHTYTETATTNIHIFCMCPSLP